MKTMSEVIRMTGISAYRLRQLIELNAVTVLRLGHRVLIDPDEVVVMDNVLRLSRRINELEN